MPVTRPESFRFTTSCAMSAAMPFALARAVAPILADDHEVCVKIALP
jgi:hypothetical protein